MRANEVSPRDPDRFCVFISSTMRTLKDLRAIVRRQLGEAGISAFVYEADQGAHPSDPEQLSLREVERTDLFVLVIDDSYGEITEREYDRARELNKPCLVYQRLGRTAAEPELLRFVKKLSGPRGVPSRTTFNDAVDLAGQLAKDVQAWLVQQYRRLSAAHLAERESSRRRAELGGSIRRLSASASRPLPSGNSADLLAWQLQEWFEALEYPLELAPVTRSDYRDLLVRVPARRRQYTRVLVRAKDGEIQSLDVEAIQKDAAEQPVDEVWLVSFRRISPSARTAVEGHSKILLYTLDDLIEEDVDFRKYFEWLEDQVQAADIDRLYVPLAITVNEIDASGALHAQSKYDDVASYVDQWLEDNDGEHLSLLGEFGTGKSWFALKYANDMVGRYRDAQQRGTRRPRVPLVIRLREYARGFKDVGSLLTEFIFREHQINIRSFAALETLNRMGRLLFIFDGFDEMAARVDQQRMVDNFWSLTAVLGPGSKAILTCRTEHFTFAKQAREVLGGKLRGSVMRDLFETTRFQVATLEMFDEKRLAAVLSRRSDDKALIDAILSNQRLFDLGRRPLMVELLIEAMPNLTAENADLARVYHQAVQRKMARDITLGRTFTSMSDKMLFMCEISWHMLSKNQLKINYKEMPDRIREYFGSRAGAVEEDHWRHDLLSQTMLVRDDDGFYRPAHKSLIEFFSAFKLAAALGAIKEEYVEAVRGHTNVNRTLSPADQRWSVYFRQAGGGDRSLAPLARFSVETLDELEKTWGRLSVDAAISELIFLLCGRDALLACIKQLKSEDARAGPIAARVLEVAAFSGDLGGVNLSGAEFWGSRLSNCDLTHANLSGSSWKEGILKEIIFDFATLRGASFRGTILSDVTFRHADLSECSFENVEFRFKILGAVWCTRGDEEVLIAVVADGRVAAISPLASTIQEIEWQSGLDNLRSGEELTAWLSGVRGIYPIGELGPVSFARNGWQRNRAWQDAELAEGLKSNFSVGSTGPHQDVEYLDIRVTEEATQRDLLTLKIYDATDLGAGNSGKRAMAIAKSGTKIAVISGVVNDPEKAEILGSGAAAAVALSDFSGSLFGEGPATTDTRGAAFSNDESLLAICERRDVIGFWRTATGELVGRVTLRPAAHGSVYGGAQGLPSDYAALTVGNGWLFETTSHPTAG